MTGVLQLMLVVGVVSCMVVLPTSVKAFIPTTGTIRSSASNTRCHATNSPRPTQQGDVPAARVNFLRTTAYVLTTAAAGLAVLPPPSNAGVFVDDTLGFQFETPEGWERGETQISGRRKIIVYTSPNDPSANAFVAYTPVRGDFTSLGSFGTLDEVSKTILPGGEGVKSTLVDAYTRNKSYVYDYIVTQDGRPEKHIKTLWLLFPEEGQLATITAQCNEEDYGRLGKAVDGLIASIKKK